MSKHILLLAEKFELLLFVVSVNHVAIGNWIDYEDNDHLFHVNLLDKVLTFLIDAVVGEMHTLVLDGTVGMVVLHCRKSETKRYKKNMKTL